MGCIGSRLSNVVRNRSFSGRGGSGGRRGRGHLFPVLNVDDMGRQISPGKLEVTETDLVLYVRGKPPLTWPLRCLRRYGYDNDLFSFESGRRCPTGAGIFAFRCNRAQSLFNLLQLRIQGSNNPVTPNNTVPTTPLTPTTTSCSNNPSTPVSSTFIYVNLAENSSTRHQGPDVTNINNLPNGQSNPSLTLPQQAYCGTDDADGSHHLYMNVDGPALFTPAGRPTSLKLPSHDAPSSSTTGSRNSMSMQLRNGDPRYKGADANNLYTNVVCPPLSTVAPSSCTSNYGNNEPAEINYAELDLKTDNNCLNSKSKTPHPSSFSHGGKENGQPHQPAPQSVTTRTSTSSAKQFRLGSIQSPSTSKPQGPSCQGNISSSMPQSSCNNNNGQGEQLGYATIDFDRTAALGVVTRSKINLDSYGGGSADDHQDNLFSRKTRHNSTAL